MKLFNKNAVITGASVGIGQAVAVKLAAEGAKVMLLARSENGLKETLDLVIKAGGTGAIFRVDLRDVDAIRKFAEDFRNIEKESHIIVNVAGVWHSESKAYAEIDFIDYTTAEILETYSVGITAPTILCHELIPFMKEGGKIINISGTFENGAKVWLPYYVSKKAIEDLTVGLAEELLDRHIQVNCVSPSDVASDPYKKFFPEYATPENALLPADVANSVLRFISGDLNSMTGQILTIKKET
jgi:NAD(P)-dependent dehydrogenase (short-subunit alcohol dehydrogenase family)